ITHRCLVIAEDHRQGGGLLCLPTVIFPVSSAHCPGWLSRAIKSSVLYSEAHVKTLRAHS
ncbi:unnamed protein product, partial [Staurois parvus]